MNSKEEFNEMVAYDFSTLDFQQKEIFDDTNSNLDCYGCDNCNCQWAK